MRQRFLTSLLRDSRGGAIFCGLLLSLLLSPGCAYRLGPTNGLSAGSKSIKLALFQNETLEPRLTEAIGHALRRKIQHDGTFRLETRERADITLSGVITRFDRSALSFDPNDIVTPRDFNVAMVARVTAIDNQTGKVLLNREVSGRTTVRTGRDLGSAERQAAPLIADDLARNIIALLADGTW